MMVHVLANKNEIQYRIYEHPNSSLTIDKKRIKYYDYITSLQNEDCNAALRRIAPRIDLHAMCSMIDVIPCISDIQNKFYKTMLSERKEKIIDHALALLHEQEQGTPIQAQKELITQNSRVRKLVKRHDDHDDR